jgi:HEAT repeat protein
LNQSNHVATLAAQIIGEVGLSGLAPSLSNAFSRFMIEAEVSDPGCSAKVAIVAALARLEINAEDVFLRAVRHIQLEASYGEFIDTAVELRAAAAIALAENQNPAATKEAILLLVDGSHRARLGAVRALRATSSPAAALILRYKALVGDPEAEVVEECLRGLLDIEPEALPFVATFLAHPDESIAIFAALAIGESHLPGAFELLLHGWNDDTSAALRGSIIVAISMLRSDESRAFLLDTVTTAEPDVARQALMALAVYAFDEKLQGLVREAVQKRHDDTLTEDLASLF